MVITYKLFLDDRTERENKKYALKLRITYYRQHKVKPINVELLKEEWDATTQKVKSKLEDFGNYVHPNSFQRRYTLEEAQQRNKLLDKCIDVCSIYTSDTPTYLSNLFQLEKAGMY